MALNAGRFRTSEASREEIGRRSRFPSSPGETSEFLWFRPILLIAQQQTYIGLFHVKAFSLQQRHELLAILQFQAEKGDMISCGILDTKEVEPLKLSLPLG
jgi:hypothetical protein